LHEKSVTVSGQSSAIPLAYCFANCRNVSISKYALLIAQPQDIVRTEKTIKQKTYQTQEVSSMQMQIALKVKYS